MSGLKIGIDEAGRGPVIGPLVVCALCIPDEDERVLQEFGARDSKELSPAERRDISEKILSEAESSGWGVGIVICEAERIDSNSQYSDLNRLEIELFAEAIEAAAESGSRGTVMADACDVNEERFTSRLVSRLGSDWSKWKVFSRHGMDSQNVVAGAASILAKVRRDEAISVIESQLGIIIGSGYPSDPLTKGAVKQLVSGELPHECLRWSWSTVSDAWMEVHGGSVPLRTVDGPTTLQSSLDEW